MRLREAEDAGLLRENTVLEVDITKKLRDYTMHVEFCAGDGITGILGASGCAKSMTLKCIAGLETPDEGRIILNGKTLFDKSRKINLKPQDRYVGYLFQNYALFPNMTVSGNIRAGMRKKALKAADRDEEDILRRLVSTFRLEGLEDTYPERLSGGQQQRVALARIFASEPALLLLDEPFSALDAFLREEMQLTLDSVLSSGFSGSCIMVTHDRDEAYRLCPDMMIMDEGRIVAQGRTCELFAKPDNFISARVTGCKNLSSAVDVGDGFVDATDWGLRLYIGDGIRQDLAAVGIRAHDFEAVADDMDGARITAQDQTKAQVRAGDQVKTGKYMNIIPLRNPGIVSGPFEEIITFESEKGARLWWKRGKNKGSEDLPKYLCIDPANILQLSK